MFTQDDNQPVVLPATTDDQNLSVKEPASDNVDDSQTSVDSSATVTPPVQDAQGGYVDSYSPPPQDNQTSTIQQMPLGSDKIGDVATQDIVKPEGVDATESASAPDSSDSSSRALHELEELMKKMQNETGSVQQGSVVQPMSQQDKPEQQTVPGMGKTSQDDDLSISSNPDQQDIQLPSSPMASKMTMPSDLNKQNDSSEALDDQNIFFLLGAEDGSIKEQEQFLDELQQTVWDDFVQKDLDLLVTSQEKVKADEILNNADLTELQKQEQLLEFLDGLIPDLEEIMLEKALKLKENLVKERVASYKELFAQNQEKLQKLEEVEKFLDQGKWRSVGETLNGLS